MGSELLVIRRHFECPSQSPSYCAHSEGMLLAQNEARGPALKARLVARCCTPLSSRELRNAAGPQRPPRFGWDSRMAPLQSMG